MRKLIFALGCIFLIILVIATGVFAFLFFRSQTELSDKSKTLADTMNENAQLQSELLNLEASETDDGDTLRFEDTGSDILVEYPKTWELTISTDISEDFATEPYERVITEYDVNLQKGTTTLSFSRILGAVDGFGSGLKESEYQVVDLNDNLVRFALAGSNEWTYTEKINCADIELFLEESPTNYDVCVGSFFPNFANLGATQANITTSDNAILAEADEIVLSTQ